MPRNQPPRPPGATVARGYGRTHQALRKQWAPMVATGRVICWRCHKHILPGQKWHLGHDDHNRAFYRGPEHVVCNCGVNRVPARPPAQALDFFRT